MNRLFLSSSTLRSPTNELFLIANLCDKRAFRPFPSLFSRCLDMKVMMMTGSSGGARGSWESLSELKNYAKLSSCVELMWVNQSPMEYQHEISLCYWAQKWLWDFFFTLKQFPSRQFFPLKVSSTPACSLISLRSTRPAHKLPKLSFAIVNWALHFAQFGHRNGYYTHVRLELVERGGEKESFQFLRLPINFTSRPAHTHVCEEEEVEFKLKRKIAKMKCFEIWLYLIASIQA